MRFFYDIIVVGAGHAGCEAAVAAARMGADTLLITMDMSKMANMSCNPAVGGMAKGQIVREIDALGGQMGVITDRSTIQFRMLGRSKGAAMWSPRAQCDKDLFSRLWRETIDNTDGLSVWQDEVVGVICDETKVGDRKRISGVKTAFGVEFKAKKVVLTNGTFLGGLMHVGEKQSEGGRAGDKAAKGLSGELEKLGFTVDRMKTGTPVRIDGRTIDFSVMERQDGDENPSKFSFLSSSKPVCEQMPCYLVYTDSEIHDTLRGGFDRSPLFTGVIRGIGPRYCPSIEDKLRTFADKESHQLFLEPEGLSTNEYYLNGFSSSLPLEVQVAALNKIKGLENAQIYRPGYAIEYDFFPPTQLTHTLETKLVEGLYFAGQINGTTGYEEAGAQGLMAGINAVCSIQGKKEVVLGRNDAYIGVLIDDLVTKGVDEPYRMFTSRAEYRILLRGDNADQRLTSLAHDFGLVDEQRWSDFSTKMQSMNTLEEYINTESYSPEECAEYFESVESANINQKRKLVDIILRNDVTIPEFRSKVTRFDTYLKEYNFCEEVCEGVEIKIKYQGYIERENIAAERIKRLERLKIPLDFDYSKLLSLTIEARQKLSSIRPINIGQASRIPGVSPSDINILLIYFGR